MQVLLLLAIIIIVERITHKSVLEMVTWVLKKIWGVIEWFILFFTRMNEPRGKKS
jgi:hypothetical protein